MDERTCDVDGCARTVLAKDLCLAHYAQLNRGVPRESMTPGVFRNHRWNYTVVNPCLVPGCGRLGTGERSSGLCGSHQEQEHRGIPRATMLPFPPAGYVRLCSVASCNEGHYGRGFCRRHHQRNRLYGLSAEEMARIDAIDLCEACGQTPPESVDHCHATGVFRGALCQRCNVAEGLLRGDPVVTRALANYMEQAANRRLAIIRSSSALEVPA